MQVLGGQLRGLRLQSLPSQQVRPTARRVRVRLFDLLGERIVGARFLDLCAGSGAVGIEALSRGASHVTFVDCSTLSCDYVRLNLKACGTTTTAERAVVVNSTAFEALREAAARGERFWDIAYFDPPYSTDYAPVLNLFATGNLLNSRGLLVIEHHCHQQPDAGGSLAYIGTAEFRETCVSFFEQQS